nr:hypothetical protein [Tanacetum cinerariifolium]GEY04562.1 hypothetical protein [Tanacetum cinerariifolium]
MENLIQDNKHLEEMLDSHGAHLYTLESLDIPQQVSKAVDVIVTDAVDWAIQAPLQNRFKDLPEADMKEILHQRMWETNSYKTHEDHMMLYEALEKSMNHDHSEELLKDLVKARKKKKKRRDSSKTPPGSPPHQPPPLLPPECPSGTSRSSRASGSSQVLPTPHLPPSTNQEGQSHGFTAPSSSKIVTSAEYKSWITIDTRLKLFVSSNPEDLQMDDDMALDAQAHSFDDEDIKNAHMPKASALASTYSPPPKDSLLAQTGDMAMFMDCVDDSIIRQNVSKPLPLGGPPGQVTIQSDFFFNKDLEYLRYGSKGSRHTLSISKMKAAYYLDVGLEKMVPDQICIEEECKAVRTHMQILSVVRIEVFSMCGYDYIKKIILHRADLNEHIIAERDFKYLYPSNFEDSQRVEDFQLGIEGYQTQLNLTKPRWDATAIEYKHDYMTRKDVDRRKEFMFAIQKWLKIRRIFRNLESFIGGRVRDGDYRLLKRTE